MAGADAARSAGSLLVRALAVGGLTAAAWLIGGAVASAAPADHSDEIAGAHDVVKTAMATSQQHRDDALSVLDNGPQAIRESWATSLADSVLASTVHTLPVNPQQLVADQSSQHTSHSFLPATHEAVEEDSESEDPRESYSYSGGSYSDSTKSGSTSNTVPQPLLEAKREAKAAAKRAAIAAAQAVPAVEAAPAAESVTSTVVPQRITYAPTTSTPVSIEDIDVESYTELDWEVPTPSAPAPGPQPISAPAAPTASSSSHDNSGGTRGVLAVTTAQSSLHPATTWSVERRDDGRTPGSEQGLPSSSPD